MTKPERILAERLKDHDSVILTKYKSLNGKEYYKCITTDGRPLNLITKSLFYKLEQRLGMIKQHEDARNKYTLNVTQLKANLLDYQIKKNARNNKVSKSNI